MANVIPKADLLVGLEAIAEHCQMTVPQAKHYIKTAAWPTFKMGRIVCIRPTALAAHFAKLECEAR